MPSHKQQKDFLKELKSYVRNDVYPERVILKKETIYRPRDEILTDDVIENHLANEPNVGAYVMFNDGEHVRCAVFDLDAHKDGETVDAVEDAAKRILGELPRYGLSPIVFRSGGGKGIHIWFLWDRPQAARKVRFVLNQILESVGYHDGTKGVAEQEVEIFPKQDKVAKGKYGNLIALPFGRKSAFLPLQHFFTDAAADTLSIRHSKPITCNIPDAASAKRSAIPANADGAMILDALTWLDDYDDYHSWIQTGLCLKAAARDELITDEEGLSFFHKYSQQSDKYDANQTDKQWERLLPHSIGIGSLLKKAKDLGWKPQKGSTTNTYFAGTNGELYGNLGSKKNIWLCNFTASIVSETIFDDGSGDVTKRFEVATNRFGTFMVDAEAFENLKWVAMELGAKAQIVANKSYRGHIPLAIQRFSNEIATRTIYGHTGWRKIGGVYHYLHAAGAISAAGHHTDFQVQLHGGLVNYDLAIPAAGKAVESVQASLRVLELLPKAKAYAVLAAIYAAPLAEFWPIQFVFFLLGATGVGKSVVAHLMQAHFGKTWGYTQGFLGNWSSTANALEAQAFTTKDAIIVVDDFAPSGGRKDNDSMHAKAERLIRNAGNNAARSRMNSKAELQAELQPRGLIVSTGEDCPKGGSIAARMLILAIDKGDVNFDKLTELQSDAADGLFAEAMGGFIQYIAQKSDGLKDKLRDTVQAYRKELSAHHARTPSNMASLLLGLREFLDYAAAGGAISAEEAERHWSEGYSSIASLGKEVEAQMQSIDPVAEFFGALNIAISGGMAHLGNPDKEDSAPDIGAPESGWKAYESKKSKSAVPQGKLIGWTKDGELYLWLDSAYTVAQQVLAAQNNLLSVGKRTLVKRIDERGMIRSRDEGRNEKRMTFSRKKEWVVHLSLQQCLGISLEPSM